MNFKEEINDIQLEKTAEEFEEIEQEILRLEKQGVFIDFSKDLDEKMHQMIKKFESIDLKKTKIKKRNKYIQIAAMITICLTVGFTAVTINADAFRIKLFDFITKDHGTYMDVNIVEKGKISPETKEKFPKEWDSVFYPMSLPEGYELMDTYETGNIKGFIFNKKEDEKCICFQYSKMINEKALMDSEKADVGRTTVDGKEALYAEKEDHIILVWVENEYQFLLKIDKGNLRDVKEIAENISYIRLN